MTRTGEAGVASAERLRTVVLQTGGLRFGTEGAVVEKVLGVAPASSRSTPTRSARRRPSASIPPRPRSRSCALGRGVRLPLRRAVGARAHLRSAGRARAARLSSTRHDGRARRRLRRPRHGGHAGMSMAAMVRDMRNRFLVALAFTIPIVLWSMVGSELLGTELRDAVRDRPRHLAAAPQPAGRLLRVRRSSSPAPGRALRARTLDMMVLVAVAIGTGWVYSVAATFFIEGEVFYEAAAMLATLRPARALVRDARPRRHQRRDPGAARPRPADGAGHPRRRAGRGSDRRGRRSATCC